jgi:hypothetical protein
MERTAIRRWICFFCSILVAVVVADTLSGILVRAAGFTGSTGFIAGFVIYALAFFSLLYGIERFLGIRFFSLPRSQG